MGTGYTRRASAEIQTNEDIEAPPLNAEFNAIEAAFDRVEGHSHDGTLGEGPQIDLETSIVGVLPVANGGIGAKHNPAADRAPKASDDSSQGYGPGSIWLNVVTKALYIAVSSAIEGAVWLELTKPSTVIGEVATFALPSAPTGWLEANGAPVLVSTYEALAAAIYCGDANNATAEWGYRATNPASPSTTRSVLGDYIVLPDLRGEFVRGLDKGRGVDTGRSLYMYQTDLVKAHTHTATTASGGAHGHTGSTASAGDHTHTITVASGGAHSHTGSAASAGDHSHTITVASGGEHTHTASSTSAGGHAHTGTTSSDSHSHTASTNTTGGHTHTVPAVGVSGGTNGMQYWAGGAVQANVGSSYAGDHAHTVTVNASSHSHTFTTSTTGAHTHPITVDNGGAHTHTGTSNSTGAHTHTVTIDSGGEHAHTGTADNAGAHTHTVTIENGGEHSHTTTITPNVGTENRPRNVALLYCICYL